MEETGAGLLVPPDNPPALAEALESLLDDPVTADEMGKRGAEAMQTAYSADAMTDAVEAIYRDVCG